MEGFGIGESIQTIVTRASETFTSTTTVITTTKSGAEMGLMILGFCIFSTFVFMFLCRRTKIETKMEEIECMRKDK